MTSNLKLGVEVVCAYNLLPKDGQGSCSAFVELNFDGLRLRTTIKEKDLNPVWNESFYFNISDPSNLQSLTLDAYVYSSTVKATSSRTRSFLGKISLTGDSFVPYSSDVVVSHYSLEKRRSIFSRVRGDLGLKVYVTDHDPSSVMSPSAPIATQSRSTQGNANFPATNNINSTTSLNAGVEAVRHTSHRLPNPSNDHQQQQQQHHDSRAAPAVSTKYEANDFAVKKTSPDLGGGEVVHGRFIQGHKTANAYDLVERMDFLYVRVVKARNLPAMGVTGSLDPFVELRIGDYKGTTSRIGKQRNPVWNEVFTFSKGRIQSSELEVVIKVNDPTTKDDDDFDDDDDDDVDDDDDDDIQPSELKVDEVVGYVSFDLNLVPKRVPPDSPLDPEWYGIHENRGNKRIKKGELMLAVWFGTQADDAFSEAWHLDADIPVDSSLVDSTIIRSKVYNAPKLWYMRVNVIEARDLFSADKNRFPAAFVKLEYGNQVLKTRVVQDQNLNPLWNEELLFVAAEPFEDHNMLLSVNDRGDPKKFENIIIGRVLITLSDVDCRADDRIIQSRWYNLEKLPVADDDEVAGHHDQSKKEKFSAGRVQLRICLEGGYHVWDESTHYSSDLRPTAEQLWRPSIGILELGILEAEGILPMKTRGGTGTSDTYCVAKYGNKWVRTRTVIGNMCPKYNEPYSWEVFEPSTVLTVGVFDNSLGRAENSNFKGYKDKKIGKVQVRISTLEAGRIYTNSYPLVSLHPTGVMKMGELHLAIRFSCTSFVNRLWIYSQPLLPEMHYARPITAMQLDSLCYQAGKIVAARLARAEPPLRREVVEYMSLMDYHPWSIRRSKANFFRIMAALSGLFALVKWFGDICMWKNPILTMLAYVLFLMLVRFPQLILPTAFLCMFLTGLWNFRFRPEHPPHINITISHAELAHPDELDEEFDTFPTSRSSDVVRMRYDRLRSVAGRIQTVAGDVATQMERIQALLIWRDSHATALFVTFCLVAALVLYVTPFQLVAALAGLFMMMPPRLRHRIPLGPINFYRRLPSRAESLI